MTDAASIDGSSARWHHVLVAHVGFVVTVACIVAELFFIEIYSPSQAWSWGLITVLFNGSAAVVGWLIAWKRPDNAQGWLMLSIGFLFALQGPTGLIGIAIHPRHSVAAEWLLSYGGADSNWSWLPALGLLLTQVPLRFPTGTLPSPRWRWFSRYTIAALLWACVAGATQGRTVSPGVPNPFYSTWDGAASAVQAATFFGLVVAFVGSIASLFVRYRRAGAVEKTQLRWVYWAVTAVIASLIGSTLTGWLAWEFISATANCLIPLAILFAVLRYGLYSIDRIISRTAAYASVTLAAVGVYTAAVIVLALLLPGVQQLGVAIATLAAAAVFLPLLRVVRRWLDRRFNRVQYDAERVVEGFGELVRNGTVPSHAGDDLTRAVQQALQPSAIGIWTASSK